MTEQTSGGGTPPGKARPVRLPPTRHGLVYHALWHTVRAGAHLLLRLQIEGMENVPKIGGGLICPNHTAWMDPPLMGALLPRPVYYITKQEAFVPLLRGLLWRVGAYPVDRTRADRGAIHTTIELVRSGHLVLLFPEGTRSRTGKLGPPRAGAVKIGRLTGAPVIPVGITGPYRLRGPLTIRIGKPLFLTESQSAADVMDAIAGLIDPPHVPRR